MLSHDTSYSRLVPGGQKDTVVGSYVDVPNSYLQAVRIALC